MKLMLDHGTACDSENCANLEYLVGEGHFSRKKVCAILSTLALSLKLHRSPKCIGEHGFWTLYLCLGEVVHIPVSGGYKSK